LIALLALVEVASGPGGGKVAYFAGEGLIRLGWNFGLVELE